jgi:hypothetical protein
MDFSINVPYRQRIVFQMRIQKTSAPRKSLDLAKAAAEQSLGKALERELDQHREKFYLFR